MSFSHTSVKSISSFTLVELLIVIGILSILTVAVVVVLNPSELLKQSRDSTRLSDLASLHTALQHLQTQTDISLGTASTVYVSLPDTSATCSNLSLPSLPSGYSYHCVPQASSTLLNGSGWLPIDFTQSNIQNFSKLPLDPTNTSSTGLYYTYTTNGSSYELTNALESTKYRLGGPIDKASTDGGKFPDLTERGTNLSLLPLDYGDPSLVGYWTFDEGSGTTSYNRSGVGNNITFSNSSSWRTGVDCKMGGCTEISGSDIVTIPYYSQLNTPTNVTYSQWVKVRVPMPTNYFPVSLGSNPHKYYGLRSGSNGTVWYFEYGLSPCDGSSFVGFAGVTLGTNVWRMLTVTYNGLVLRLYVDGVQSSVASFSSGFCSNTSSNFVLGNGTGSGFFSIDDSMIYNRALSASEVLALYNSTK